MRIIVLCGSMTAVSSLYHLSKKNYISALIYSQVGEPGWWLSLETWAADRGLPCWQAEQETLETELSELVREINPELIIAFNFPYTLPDHLVQQLKLGAWKVQLDLQNSEMGNVTIHRLGTPGEEPVLKQDILLLPAGESGSTVDQLNLLSLALLQTAIRTTGTMKGMTLRFL